MSHFPTSNERLFYDDAYSCSDFDIGEGVRTGFYRIVFNEFSAKTDFRSTKLEFRCTIFEKFSTKPQYFSAKSQYFFTKIGYKKALFVEDFSTNRYFERKFPYMEKPNEDFRLQRCFLTLATVTR